MTLDEASIAIRDELAARALAGLSCIIEDIGCVKTAPATVHATVIFNDAATFDVRVDLPMEVVDEIEHNTLVAALLVPDLEDRRVLH